MNNDGCETPIRVPSAPFRPGESASFEEWSYSPSDLMKPDPLSCEPKDTIPHSTGLIRVLGDDDSRSGDWDPDISDSDLLIGLEHMVRLRIFDDRMMKMQRTGKLSFYMRSLGEEAVAIAQTMALEEQDWIFPIYQIRRGHSVQSYAKHRQLQLAADCSAYINIWAVDEIVVEILNQHTQTKSRRKSCQMSLDIYLCFFLPRQHF